MNVYLLLPAVQVVISIGLALLVMAKGRRSPAHRLFLLFLCGLGVWGVLIFAMRGSPDTNHALFWERILVPLIILVPSFCYHFTIEYTGSRSGRWLLPGLYLISAALVPLAFTDLVVKGMQLRVYGYAPIFGPLMPFVFSIIMLLSVLALKKFARVVRTSPDPAVRTRALYITVGIVILLIGGILDILPTLGLPVYPGFVIGNIIFGVLTSTAMLKHNLLDVRVVLRKSAAYFFTTSSFIVLSIVLSFLLASYTRYSSQLSYIAALSALTLVMPVLWSFFQRRVDRWFYGNRYENLRALEMFSRETQNLAEQALGQKAVKLLTRAMRASHASILVPASPESQFAVAFTTDGRTHPDATLDPQSPLLKWLAHTGVAVSRYDLELMPQFVGRERVVLVDLDVGLLAPGRTPRGDLSALILLGKKLSRQPYTEEEKQMITTFADQISTKLENTRLYNEALEMKQELRTLSHRLVQVQEDERREIAHELHDEIGQALIMTKMLLDRAAGEPAEVEGSLEHAQAIVKEVIGQIREMSLNLRPSILDDLGLLPALEWFMDRFTKRTGVQVEFRHEGIVEQFPGDVRTAAYRVLQEGLNNIAKHARTPKARVSISVKADILHIELSDEGIGFDPGAVSGQCAGLMGMRERVAMLGGSMRLDSAPGNGTWIGVDLPFSERRERNGQGYTC